DGAGAVHGGEDAAVDGLGRHPRERDRLGGCGPICGLLKRLARRGVRRRRLWRTRRRRCRGPGRTAARRGAPTATATPEAARERAAAGRATAAIASTAARRAAPAGAAHGRATATSAARRAARAGAASRAARAGAARRRGAT